MAVRLQCLLPCHHTQMFNSNGIYGNSSRIRLLGFLIPVKSRHLKKKSRHLTLITRVRILSEVHGLDLEVYKELSLLKRPPSVPSSARFQPKEPG